MRILVVITYYRPHTSGLTIYAERLAKAFAVRGHQVTVLTSQYSPDLPREEMQDGVRIVRVPVLFRISKGVIMPSFGLWATKLVLEHDVIQLHLPQFDAAGVALRGRLLKKPIVITYHCDLRMPPGLLSWLANQVIRIMNNLAALFTHRIVTYTQDYGEHSPYLSRYLRKLKVISPPVVLPEVSQESIQEFSEEINPEKKTPLIGMVSRFATEKGVEVLLDAMPGVFEKYPNASVLFAGAYQNIIGEEKYYERLCPRIDRLVTEGRWKFLGNLDPEQIAKFYPLIDVLVMPSLNSTESFGLVQIEAMMNRTPSIASNLPGVRQPVLRHKMGRIIEIGDSAGLTAALLDVLGNPGAYQGNSQTIAREYLPDSVAANYENLYDEIFSELS